MTTGSKHTKASRIDTVLSIQTRQDEHLADLHKHLTNMLLILPEIKDKKNLLTYFCELPESR